MSAIKHAADHLRYVTHGSIIIAAALDDTGTMHTGKYNDIDRVANHLIGMSHEYREDFPSIFHSLPPPKPDEVKGIGDFGFNSLRRKGRSLSDRAVAGRQIYYLDFYPVRPSNISSTDTEKLAARIVMDKVGTWLREHRWPEPVVVDSGNGYHLLYRGDLCNAYSSAWLFLLRKLAAMFNTPQVKVDTSVGNPGRLVRLPGSWNCKGENSPERPWRRCKGLLYPINWLSVDHGVHVYKVAYSLGFDRVERKQARRSANRPDLADDVHDRVLAFFAEFPDHLELHEMRETGDNTFYDLAFCPFVGRRHSNDNGRKTSIIVGHAVGFHCFSDDCGGMQALREFLHKKTGRWPKTRFTAETEQQKKAREERAMKRFEQQREDERASQPEIAYSQHTFDMIHSGQLTTTKPADYDLSVDHLREPFCAWLLLHLQASTGTATLRMVEDYTTYLVSDADMMARLMGPENLYAIYRDRRKIMAYGWNHVAEPVPTTPLPLPGDIPFYFTLPTVGYPQRDLVAEDDGMLEFLRVMLISRLESIWNAFGVTHEPNGTSTSPYKAPEWLSADHKADEPDRHGREPLPRPAQLSAASGDFRRRAP